MKFIDFKNKFDSQVIDMKNVNNCMGRLDPRRLFEWQKKGYIKRITNNYYIFSDYLLGDGGLNKIANLIYIPSYVALESALSFYNYIPEVVFQVTSITTRRNKNLNTDIAFFKYYKIKPALFFGYVIAENNKNDFLISSPEKTILDFLYYNPHICTEDALLGMRFNFEQLKKSINQELLYVYLTLFKSKSLEKRVNRFMRLFDAKY